MAQESATTPRARYRAQVRAEVKQHAWEQIGAAGASALSLNSIARRMGMSGPALYRYFASRDELITELVTDAYQSLADAFHAAAASGAGLAGLARTLREWATADPQRYLLIYGTPIPGYHAPAEATAITAGIMATLLDACAPLPLPPADGEAPLAAHLGTHREWTRGHPAPPAALQRALTFWTRLHGVLSLEVAGHFAGMGFDPAVLFESEVAALTGAAGE
ncbi:TetR/AcrR family transcriptional regulator [Streptomyces sp. NPDC050560]|uniref:TetR/AcrR family transcriptional regulator n=1 Tax=Streptomyces sp. NPDC050560 TaxID=3365630 RepID=UPI0037AE0755